MGSQRRQSSGGDSREGVSIACYHQRYKTLQVSIPGSSGSVTLSAFLPKEDIVLAELHGELR